MSDGWLYLEHEETGGTQRIPDDPAVLASQEARGWRVVDEPEPPVGLPPKVNIDPAEQGREWVELVHPLTGARHSFPNNPDAVKGAHDAGWVEPKADGGIPKASQRKAAKAAGVDVDDLPAHPDEAPQQDATLDPSGVTAGVSDQAESSATTAKE